MSHRSHTCDILRLLPSIIVIIILTCPWTVYQNTLWSSHILPGCVPQRLNVSASGCWYCARRGLVWCWGEEEVYLDDKKEHTCLGGRCPTHAEAPSTTAAILTTMESLYHHQIFHALFYRHLCCLMRSDAPRAAPGFVTIGLIGLLGTKRRTF